MKASKKRVSMGFNDKIFQVNKKKLFEMRISWQILYVKSFSNKGSKFVQK